MSYPTDKELRLTYWVGISLLGLALLVALLANIAQGSRQEVSRNDPPEAPAEPTRE